MRIGIDLDGVCYDFAASLRHYLWACHRYDEADLPNPTRWEFYEDWGIDLPNFLKYCHAGVDAGIVFSHGNPYPGTLAALRDMKHAGHTLHVVTDRSFGTKGASEAATRAWLDKHGLPFDSLTFSSDKTVVRLDAMIDDKLGNYDALEAAGVDAYLLDRPWNQQADTRQRVPSLAAFANALSAVAA